MALTKAEMAEHLFEKLGINKRDAKDLVETFFEEVREALESGEQVKLSGFGNLVKLDKNQQNLNALEVLWNRDLCNLYAE